MRAIFPAFVSGFCLRGALQSAGQGSAWWALILGVMAVANIVFALAWAMAPRSSGGLS